MPNVTSVRRTLTTRMRRYSLPRPVNVGAATCGAAAAVAGGGNAAGGGGSVSGNKSSSFDISLHANAPVEAGSRLDAAYNPVAVAPERGGGRCWFCAAAR